MVVSVKREKTTIMVNCDEYLDDLNRGDIKNGNTFKLSSLNLNLVLAIAIWKIMI
jgi:hypothetical protein